MAQKKRSIKFGFLFWIVFILIVLLLFFINKDNIKHVLESVDMSAISKNKVEDPQTQIQKEIERINERAEAEKPKAGEEAKTVFTEISDNDNPEITESQETETKSMEAEKSKSKKTKTNKPKPEKETSTTKTSTEKSTKTTEIADGKKNTKTEIQKSSKTQNTTKAKTRLAKLYFVVIDSDGRISRVSSDRELKVSDSPMSDALKSLFAGTTKDENQNSYRSLIPPETKLLGATVRDGVAYINVSESFEFNRYGIEGYLAELAQVVFTATEFPTVESVQFLIEGRKKNYLGSDGVWIGSPLSRNSF